MKQTKEKQTLDYQRFSYIEGNRAINNNKVQKLMKSMKEYGYCGAPIIVNESMEIIDGQHRFNACKRLGIPVPYIVREGLNISHCRELNKSATLWNAEDYVRSYASEGQTACKIILSLKDEFQFMTINGVLEILRIGKYGVSCEMGGLKNKNIRVVDQEGARKCFMYLSRFSPFIEKLKSGRRTSMYRAIAKMYCFGDKVLLDKERLFKKVSADISNMPSMENEETIFKEFISSYNKRLSNKIYYNEFYDICTKKIKETV